jgi:Fe2+ transport system protein B
MNDPEIDQMLDEEAKAKAAEKGRSEVKKQPSLFKQVSAVKDPKTASVNPETFERRYQQLETLIEKQETLLKAIEDEKAWLKDTQRGLNSVTNELRGEVQRQRDKSYELARLIESAGETRHYLETHRAARFFDAFLGALLATPVTLLFIYVLIPQGLRFVEWLRVRFGW